MLNSAVLQQWVNDYGLKTSLPRSFWIVRTLRRSREVSVAKRSTGILS